MLADRRRARLRRLLALALILLMFVPLGAFAARIVPPGGLTSGMGTPAWTIYTIGNGPVLYDLLVSIKALVQSSVYKNLVLFLVVLGFVVSMIGQMVQLQLQRIGLFILGVSLVAWMVNNLTVHVMVDDTATGYVNTVQDVPAVAGLPASVFSLAGDAITRAVETYFNQPNYNGLKLTGGAQFNMAAQVVKAMNTPVIPQAEIRATFNAYFTDCVVPFLANGTIGISELMHASPESQDILTVIGEAASPSLLTSYWPLSGGGMQTVTCQTAYNNATNDISAVYGSVLQETMRQQGFQFFATTGTSGAVANLFEQSIKSSFDYLSNSSATSPSSIVLQSAAMQLMRGGFTYAAARSSQEQVLAAINIEQGLAQQRGTWFATAQFFAQMAPLLYVVLYAFVIGFAPIIIAALFIPRFGGVMGLGYVRILIWLLLWQPALSILNYIIALFARTSMGNMMGSSGVWSLTTSASISQAAQDYVLIGGFLAASLPFILYSLVHQGSMAMTAFMEGAVPRGAAAAAGQSIGSGNLSMGNVSLDNTSMNKYDIASSRRMGNALTQIEAASAGAVGYNQDAGGNTARIGGVAATTTSTETERAARQQAVFEATSRVYSASERLSSAVNSLYNKSYNTSMTASQGQGGERNTQYSDEQREQMAMREGISTTYRALREAGFSQEQSMAMAVGAALRSSGKGGAAGEIEKLGSEGGKGAGFLDSLAGKLRGFGGGAILDALGLSSEARLQYNDKDSASLNAKAGTDTSRSLDSSTDRGVGASSSQSFAARLMADTRTQGGQASDYTNSQSYSEVKDAATQYQQAVTAQTMAQVALERATSTNVGMGLTLPQAYENLNNIPTAVDNAVDPSRDHLNNLNPSEVEDKARAAATKIPELRNEINNGKKTVDEQGAKVQSGVNSVRAGAGLVIDGYTTGASQKATNPNAVAAAQANQMAANNDRMAANLEGILASSEAVSDKGENLLAAFGAIYGTSRFGPLGGLIGGGATLVGLKALDEFSTSSGEAKLQQFAQDARAGMGDIRDASGRTLGEAVGFILDQNGGVHAAYLFQSPDGGGQTRSYIGTYAGDGQFNALSEIQPEQVAALRGAVVEKQIYHGAENTADFGTVIDHRPSQRLAVTPIGATDEEGTRLSTNYQDYTPPSGGSGPLQATPQDPNNPIDVPIRPGPP